MSGIKNANRVHFKSKSTSIKVYTICNYKITFEISSYRFSFRDEEQR